MGVGSRFAVSEKTQLAVGSVRPTGRPRQSYEELAHYLGDGARLVYSRNKGNGGTYEYFICLSRKTKRRPCRRTGIRLDKIEDGIARFYGTFQLGPTRLALLRQGIRAELDAQRATAEEDALRAKTRLSQLRLERERLLQAHYAGAVPLDLLKQEMDRLTREVTAVEAALSATATAMADLDATLECALTIAATCERHYLMAPPKQRRQINQGLFVKLFIGRDGNVERAELTEPFAALLSRNLVVDIDSAGTTQLAPHEFTDQLTSEDADVRTQPSSVFVKTFGVAGAPQTPDGEAIRRGVHNEGLVEVAGIEPASFGILMGLLRAQPVE
jgi:hypothetical protein